MMKKLTHYILLARALVAGVLAVMLQALLGRVVLQAPQV